MFKLVIEDDEGNRTIVPVIRDEISIGRRKGNTIRLNERNVSRDHARLLRDEDVVFLEDRDSRYKTLCNGIPIDGKVKFNIGDVFSIGDYALSLQSDAVADIAAAPVAASAPTAVAAPVALKKTETIVMAPGKLVVTSSNFAGQTFDLSKSEMIIGRGEECDIIIDHRSVSTLHAKIVRDAEGSYQIIDLDSKNGVKISGEEYQSIRLKRGDTVEMGHVRLRFVEPGENYVFTPQPVDYDNTFETSSSSNMWVPIIGILLLVLAAGAYYLLSGSAQTTSPQVIAEKPEVEEPIPSGSDDKSEKSEKSQNIETIIASARKHIRSGQIGKATAKLEAAKMLNPDSGQSAVIEKMLSDAVVWSSLAKALEIGEDNFNEERYGQALEKFKEISDDTSTPIYKVMSEKGLPDKAISALLKDAKKASSEGRNAEAKSALQAILLYDPEHTEANKRNKALDNVVMAVDEEPVKVAIKKKRPERKKSESVKKIKKAKVYDKDPELAKELGAAALKLFVSGNFSGAISKCDRAVKEGFKGCNRIYAVSYKRKGNVKKACKYHKRARIEPAGLDCK